MKIPKIILRPSGELSELSDTLLDVVDDVLSAFATKHILATGTHCHQETF
jgi:hypothetical protein